MEKINYSQIYQKFTKGLSARTKGVFDSRFGVKSNKTETLDSIGKRLGITRERVRQIEEVGFNFIRKNNKEALENIFNIFEDYFGSKGGFKREDIVLSDLGGTRNRPYVLFLLTIGEGRFSRVCGKKNHHHFWSTSNDSGKIIKEKLNSLVSEIENGRSLLSQGDMLASLAVKHNLNQESLASYVEISKLIQSNKEGKFGLVSWPEIRPKGVRDKAFLVFKKEKKPLHFKQITGLIDKLEYNLPSQKAHTQTVHNELIKDSRFVLVGRGTYALAEWGYVPGTIRDIISKVLKEKKEAVSQEDIVKEVLAQRLVAKNTVLINLSNKEYFLRNSDGKYLLRETQTS
jgi:DNA-directed RNA polymerase delta subunit/transcriptional regulator with XRE-family HTH domain